MFLRNAWYVAGPAEEFEKGIVSRRICNELIAFYTKADGNIAALEDRCPHRFVPLSMGSREGDDLRCGYHGLKFGPDGNCNERPGGAGENPAPICVRSYATAARHTYLWIWMGDAERANPDLIPDFSFITDPQFKCVAGHLMVAGHHELITDNLLDLSHVNYLHPHIASTSNWTEWDNKVVVEGNTVWSMLARPNQVPGVFQRKLWGSDSPTADGRGSVRWDAPSVLYADTAIAEVGADIETTGCKTPSAHFLTPETEYTTHYFWVSARNAMIDNEEITQAMQSAVHEVFSTQDGPMVAAEQRAMGESTDFLAHKPLILKADAAGIRARRILRRMIREEEQGANSTLVQEAAE
jgi:phenylpropionate dioxygenase-like ring-hydroxylating dioxygenase large terminal subunit